MPRPISILTTAAIVLGLANIPPAQAQQPSAFQKPVRISITYSLRIPYDPDNAEASEKSLENGRKSVYLILGNECDLLLTTIAKSCRMASASVRATPDRRSRRYARTRPRGEAELPTMTLRASAVLEVQMKDRPLGNE